jgi:transposase
MDNLESQVVKKYQSTTLSMAAIAKEYKITPAKAKYILKKNNVTPRPSHVPATAQRKEAAKLYGDGVTIADICGTIKRSRTVVYRYLKKEGVRD